MTIRTATPWHQASYDHFLSDSLPQLLADHMTLAGYYWTEEPPSGEGAPSTCAVYIELEGKVQAVYRSIPIPDETGVFSLNGEPYVVIPTASSEALDSAEIACVGEQLETFIQEHLGKASVGVVWDVEILQAWLPLDRWVREFLDTRAQRLDTTNWLSRTTHLRRLLIPDRKEVIAPGQLGLVCPYETPEGPNIGKAFTVAAGAEVRQGRLVIVDDSPSARLGISASMLPFLEHNDPNRLLMAASNLRQSIPAPNPESALVQTGNEPDAPDFWCGRNLLTAYISLGEITTEDGIVISETCARRLDYPRPIEAGDWLSNRHGIRGVVSQILPDREMPHLPGGKAVELVYSFAGLPARLVFGPAREALLGRIARLEGQVAFATPFASPKEAELRERMERLGLPESGQEILTIGENGVRCELPTTVGWVYWNRSIHLSRDKMTASTGENSALVAGELEYQALKTAGAIENLKEFFHTRSARRRAASSLANELAAGPVDHPVGVTPWFEELSRRLQIAGIQARLEQGRLAFRFVSPTGNSLRLAQAMPHPWLSDRTIEIVGAADGEAYTLLEEANDRLKRMLASRAPERLVQSASRQLSQRLRAYFASLLPREMLSLGQWTSWSDFPGPGESQLFGGKAVVAPSGDLAPDQVGLPSEIAWTLFAPLVSREIRDTGEVQNRTEKAAQALEKVLAGSWVIIHRPPALTPTALLAFRPVLHPEPVIRLNPLVCGPLNIDFDGDQAAVYLPVTAAAQREANEKMTLVSHLKRDPGLVKNIIRQLDLLWGLAWLNLSPSGAAEIAGCLGVEAASLPELLTQEVVVRLLEALLQREGPQRGLEQMHNLARLGFQAARNSGASFSPFLASGMSLPAMPESDDPDLWWPYMEETAEAILAGTNYTASTLGPLLLAAKIRTRNRQLLPVLVGPRGLVINAAGKLAVIRHTQIEGLLPSEAFAIVAGARRGLAQIVLPKEETPSHKWWGKDEILNWNLLARARRSKHPGIVFARAAASGEVDPLDDMDSRLLTGLL